MTDARKPLDGYPSREWKAYPITMDEGMDLPTMDTGNEFLGCLLQSPLIEGLVQEEQYDPKQMFYFDYEQLRAGHNIHGTASLMRLTDTYRGHPAGKLAFVSYEGLAEEPPTYLFFVEV